MPETSDWKQKYLASLREMESEEKRWRLVEQALRRLVGRLCAAGMGVDPQLDDQLIALAAANRRNAEAAELETLAASLTTAVIAVDAVSPVPTIVMAAGALTRWNSSCSAVGKMLHGLRPLGVEEAAVRDLVASAGKADTDADLAGVVGKAVELVHRHGEALASERVQAAALLAKVTTRLEELSGYLAASGDDARSRFMDAATVNDTVMSQVRELTTEVSGATELGVLQSLVSVRLEAVAKQVLDLRSREENRLQAHMARFEHMRARISDLEQETLDLHSKLDREKHGARIDALTRVANRKSFDERFAQALLNRSHGAEPVALLLWDLDDFKVINDSYGHRAGDRVLQSVASCLQTGVRAEDFVGRIGGEEFVMLLIGQPLARALQQADELRTRVGSLRFHFRGTPVRITASCGVTELKTGESTDGAFDRADAALYRAKRAGKNACAAA